MFRSDCTKCQNAPAVFVYEERELCADCYEAARSAPVRPPQAQQDGDGPPRRRQIPR